MHRLGLSSVLWHQCLPAPPRGTQQSWGLNWECICFFRAQGFSEERKPYCTYKMPKPVQKVPDFQGLFHRGMFSPHFGLIHSSLCTAPAPAPCLVTVGRVYLRQNS